MAGKRGKSLGKSRQVKVVLLEEMERALILEAEDRGCTFGEEVRRRLLFSFGDGVTLDAPIEALLENFRTQVAWTHQ